MPEALDEHINTRAASPAICLRSGGDGRLLVLIGDKSLPVRLRQCFPWSDPRCYLSLRDDKDREVALIDDPALLAPESRVALEDALAAAGFVLEVTRVLGVDEEVEIRHWTVETVHGPRTFQTHLDDWPRMLPGGDLLIRDVAGDLYRLRNTKTMDRRSRELLWAFID
jgi:hypothetical protein